MFVASLWVIEQPSLSGHHFRFVANCSNLLVKLSSLPGLSWQCEKVTSQFCPLRPATAASCHEELGIICSAQSELAIKKYFREIQNLLGKLTLPIH
jgi:hypothetical protein